MDGSGWGWAGELWHMLLFDNLSSSLDFLGTCFFGVYCLRHIFAVLCFARLLGDGGEG